MVISGIDQNNISIVIDTIQAKHLVELLREVTKQQLLKAAQKVHKDGWENGEIEDTKCVVTSFVNIIGNFTDKVKYVKPAKLQEAVVDGKSETQFVN